MGKEWRSSGHIYWTHLLLSSFIVHGSASSKLVLDPEPGNKPSSRLWSYATQAGALFPVSLGTRQPRQLQGLEPEGGGLGTRLPRQLQELEPEGGGLGTRQPRQLQELEPEGGGLGTRQPRQLQELEPEGGGLGTRPPRQLQELEPEGEGLGMRLLLCKL